MVRFRLAVIRNTYFTTHLISSLIRPGIKAVILNFGPAAISYVPIFMINNHTLASCLLLASGDETLP